MMYVHTHLQVGRKRTQASTPALLRIFIISRARANKKGHPTSLLPLNQRLLCCFTQNHIAIGTFGSPPYSSHTSDLDRYTVVKSGSRRLFVPNSAFLTREFIVHEDPQRQRRNLMGGALHGFEETPDYATQDRVPVIPWMMGPSPPSTPPTTPQGTLRHSPL